MGQIHELIPKIMAEVGAIEKAEYNKEQRFYFRGTALIYQHLQLLLAKHEVSVLPEVLSTAREQRATKSGGTMMTTLATVKYTFYAPDGSSLTAVTAGEGMDSGDKATPKALTMAHKSCLVQVFLIPTDDAIEPDATSPGEQDAATVTDDQLGVLRDMMNMTETEEGKFCIFLKVDKLEDLHAANFDHAMGALNTKAKQRAEA